MSGGIVELSTSGAVTIEEANKRALVVHHFTKQLSAKVESLINQLEAYGPSQKSKTEEIEAQIEALINSWNNKVRKLGGEPKGMWLVDFDAGDGYFCWKYPEADIQYWHEYKSGFPGRVSLAERENRRRLKVLDPIEDLIDQL